jgi:hypothetical protein
VAEKTAEMASRLEMYPITRVLPVKKVVRMKRRPPTLARVHSAVHAVNRGMGEAIITQCEAVGVPITRGGAAAAGLKRIQTQNEHRKLLKQSSKSRDRRYRKRKYLHRLHDKKAAKSTASPLDTYQSGLCIKQMRIKAVNVKPPRMDHSYCKRLRPTV